MVQNKGSVTICLLSVCCLSSLLFLLPDESLTASRRRRFCMGKACFQLFGSLLWSSRLTVPPSFSIYSQHTTCTQGIFSIQNFHTIPHTFSGNNCLATLIQDFDVYKFFSHTLKNTKICISVWRFTSIKSLSTVIAYGFF